MKKKKKSEITPQVKFRVEIVCRINDRFFNSHIRPIIECWQANIDFQLVLDVGKVVDYMTKYATKSEITKTRSVAKMMKTLLNDAIDKGKGVNTVLKKVMGRLIGERMLTQQETCNLILSLPMVKCSYNFVNLHLESNNNKVDLKL